jgi:NADH-quinone oxidoreductase subunit L
MVFMVFHGPERFRQAQAHGHDAAAHDDGHGHAAAGAHVPHESPWVVTLPLILLAIPSVLIGAFAIKPLMYGDFFAHGVAFGKTVFIDAAHHPALQQMGEEFHGWLPMAWQAVFGLPVWLALAGVLTAWFLYLKRPDLPAKIKARCGGLYTLLDNKYYMDKINETVFAKGAVTIGRGLWQEGDQAVIDGIVNNSARSVGWLAGIFRLLQSGYIYHYAFAMILGMAGLMTLFVTLGIK